MSTGRTGTSSSKARLERRKTQEARLMRQRQLEVFLDELLLKKLFKTRGEIARACGMTEAHLSTVLGDPDRRLTIGQCLRLARSIHASAAHVLRVAGRPDDAAVVDDLWSPAPSAYPMNRSERELIELWRSIDYDDRHHVSGIVAIVARTGRAGLDGHASLAPDETPRFGRPSRASQDRASS